ncbi:hypothetical protein TrVFT333_001756 [Trichoderma virens FT-333]|nr:hypothetical protein TrVFT333_001756 [Trichoderma virens FT-333]
MALRSCSSSGSSGSSGARVALQCPATQSFGTWLYTSGGTRLSSVSPASASSSASSSSSSTALAKKRAPARIAKGSIYGIARQFCGEELIVSPVRWTGRQLELLKLTEADYSEERSGTRHLNQFFHYYYKCPMREQGIRLLVTTDGCPLTAYDAIGLYFNGFILKRLDCNSLCLRSSLHPAIRYKRPIAALIDREHIEIRRRDSIGYRSSSRNLPIVRLFNHKWKKFCPPEPLNDPYIVALLIGVAQQKRRHYQEINCNKETSTGMIFSQVLCTLYSKGECEVMEEQAYLGWLYLYQAYIPLSLLDMFDNPRFAPSTMPSVSVQIVTIHYSPLATLRARILELVMPEKLVSVTYGLSAGGQKRKYDGEGDTQPSSRGAPAGAPTGAPAG